MTTQLELMNGALRHCGERRLASVSEDREPRHELDAVYTPALKACLEAGYWDFAMKTDELEGTAVASLGNRAFGFTYAFTKPTDWVKTFAISGNALLTPPLLDRQIADEAGFYYADIDTIYIKYVSNHATYGLDLTRWPESFVDYVAVELALRIAPRLKPGALADVMKEHKRLKANALAKDAVNAPVTFPPRGTWVTSRLSANRIDGR